MEEVNAPPEDLLSEQLLSKGFFPTVTVQDFPTRGHKVFMHIKRRHWLRVKTGEVVYRDWTSVAPGTRITQRVCRFFKRTQSIRRSLTFKL